MFDGGTTVWPISKFYFLVDFGGGMDKAYFKEVSGLDVESQTVEYRHGNTHVFSTPEMPESLKLSVVTLKKSVFVSNDKFYNWFSAIKTNAVKRVNVTIKLLDEKGSPAMTWVLQNAWPTKITGTDLKSDGSEVVIETIEIAHEGVVISNN